jgi:hypothetical protein
MRYLIAALIAGIIVLAIHGVKSMQCMEHGKKHFNILTWECHA